MNNFKGAAPLQGQDRRSLLARILDTPNLERVVPRLQPDLLHRLIQSCGLEDCGELVMLATPKQLTRIFDLDLWRPAQPGMDEQFDADRFGIWLEVLAEFGAGAAAQKLVEVDADVVIAGFAQHVRVFDGAVVTAYRTTDGIESTATREPDDGMTFDVGGYRLFAKRDDSWQAIIEILIALDANYSDYFHQVMRGCRALSNAGRELDELDDLLSEKNQVQFDLSIDRERRRDEQGYVTPAQARAFLQMSRQLRLDSESKPPFNPVARAYFRTVEQTAKPQSESPPSNMDPAEAASALVDVLLEAGIIGQQPRALLSASPEETSSNTDMLQRIRSHMQFLFDSNRAAYARRSEELTYIANSLMAGCSIQGRPFTTQQTWDGAVAVCNLGLEKWPPLWSEQDFITVFQVGWTVLHREVCMYAAERLLTFLAGLRCRDSLIQDGIHALRIQLSKSCAAEMPWRARDAMDVIAILDMPAWAALLGLIDEFPVLHTAAAASQNPRTHSVSATAFEFISETSQITTIRDFIQRLPKTLCP